jgi:hypothetical protein
MAGILPLLIQGQFSPKGLQKAGGIAGKVEPLSRLIGEERRSYKDAISRHGRGRAGRLPNRGDSGVCEPALGTLPARFGERFKRLKRSKE